MCDVNEDFVSELINKLKAHLPTLCGEKADLLESDIRSHWGGDRPYVGKTKFDRANRLVRDNAIYRDHQRGERRALLSRRYRLSPRRISQIVKIQGGLKKNESLEEK